MGDLKDLVDFVKLEEEILDCRLCPRLVIWREEVARIRRRAYKDWSYWGKPVPGFGDPNARLLAIGLAPGAHGSNRTGRMFTGDASGDFLYASLYRAGFANQPFSIHRGDGLNLSDLYITSSCRCVPPGNKPEPSEVRNCLPFLLNEIDMLTQVQGIVALGKLAFDNITSIFRRRGLSMPQVPFGHGAFYKNGEGLPWVLASYHPSRQNTQTGRLTVDMFDSIWETAKGMLQ